MLPTKTKYTTWDKELEFLKNNFTFDFEGTVDKSIEERIMMKTQDGTLVASVDEGEELTPQQKALLTEREAIEKLIQTRPEDVAQLVRTWLAEE